MKKKIAFSCCSLLLILLHFSANAQISITTFPFTYTQQFTNFDGSAAGLPAGWSFTGTAATRGQGNGSSNAGGIWAYGNAPEYALGALCSGTSSNINYTVTFRNNGAVPVTSLTIAYDFEQWRYGGGNTNGFTVTQSGIGAAVTGLNTSSGTSSTGTATVTPKTITLNGLSIAPNTNFSITWSIADGSGTDNGVAIDNFSLTASTAVTVPAVTITRDPINDTACAGMAAGYSITATNATSYQWQEYTSSWSNIANGGVYSGVATAALAISNTTGLNGRQYRCIAINGSGKDTSTAANLLVNALPMANVTPAANFRFCKGDSISLTANTGARLTYQWLFNTTPLASGNNRIYKDTASGSYSVIVTDSNGCRNTSLPVIAMAVPHAASVTPLGSLAFCTGGQVELAADSGTGFTYQWLKNGALVPGFSNDTLTANSSGSYQVIIANRIGCTDTSAAVVVAASAGPVAAITPGGPTAFCAGDSVLLDAGFITGLTYQWLLNGTPVVGATTDKYTVKNGGSYTVKVASSVTCFTYSAPAVITVNALPAAQFFNASSPVFCQNDSMLLVAGIGTGYNYQWLKNNTALTGSTDDTLVVKSAGVYSLKVTDANGCANNSNTLGVTVNPLPVSTVTPASNAAICQGDSLSLTANTGTRLAYQWYNNGTVITGSSSINYKARATGNYAVTVTDSNGCAKMSSAVSLTVNALPSVAATLSGATVFCQGSFVNISVPQSTGLTYQWLRNGTGITGASSNYNADSNGAYQVIVTNSSTACKNISAPVMVTVHPLPDAILTATAPTIFCTGDSVLLKANAGTLLVYRWMLNGQPITGINGTQYIARTSGDYSVIITDSNLCANTSAIQHVTVNPMPDNHITYSSPLAFCEGGAVVLTASQDTGITYQWLKNGQPQGITTYSNIVDATGAYSVIQTNSYNCTNTSPALSVTVWPSPPQPVISRNGLQLSTGTYARYQWYRNNQTLQNETRQTVNANENGGYSVEVVDGNGCHSKSAIVFVNNVGIGTNVSAASITIYPNPVQDLLTVAAPFKLKALLLDMQGRALIEQEDVVSMSLKDLPPGIYLLQLRDKAGTLIRTEKINKIN